MDSLHLLFFLPVGNEKTLLGTLDDVFTRAGGQVEVEKVSEHDLHQVKGLGGFFPLVLNYAEHDDYVIGVFGMEGSFEPIATLDSIWNMEDGASLMDDKAFQNRLESAGSTWHSLTYTSPAAMELMMTGLHELAAMYGATVGPVPMTSSAIVGTTHLTDDRFRYRAAQRLLPGLIEPVWFEGVKGKDKLGHKIAGKAIVATRFSLDIEALWESSMAEDLGAEAFLTELLSKGLDIDIEKDLVQNIEGHFTTVFFEPNWEDLTPEFIGYAPVKDSAPLASLADNGCRILSLWGAKLEKDDSGVWCTHGATTFFGVAHGHILIGMSSKPERYRTLEGEGYLSALPEAARKGLKSGAAGFAYLNVDDFFQIAKKQEAMLESMTGPLPDLPTSIPVKAITLSIDLMASEPETEIERGAGETPYDTRFELQAMFSDGGIQEWLANNLEAIVVWAEAQAEQPGTDSDGPAQATGVQAKLKEISEWQVMGAEELGEPYAACGSEEKANALVHGGDPNLVYSNEDRACFENIGWMPTAGTIAFWTDVQGPQGEPFGFTVHGVERTSAGIQSSSLSYPTTVPGQ
jgi:hypothetical protein